MAYVNAPGAPNYAIPSADWAALGNLPEAFYQGAQQRQQYDQTHAFQNGLPMDANGMPDYRAIIATLAQKGGINAIGTLAGPALAQQQRQQAQVMSPLFAGVGTPGAGAPNAPGSPGQLSAAPGIGAPAAPRPAAPTPQIAGSTVDQLTASAFPADASSGKAVAANIAKALKVSPGAELTPDQQAYARQLVTAYLQRSAPAAPRGLRNNNPDNIEDGSFARSQPGYVGGDGRFAKYATPEAGLNAATNLLSSYAKKGINTINGIVSRWAPPSDKNPTGVYAATVAHELGVDPNQPLDMGNPEIRQRVAGAMQGFENGTLRTGGENHPITPQVPLPHGFNDPQQAILAIDQEIAKLGTNPAAAEQITALKDWRDRIAASQKPIQVGASSTIINPATGQAVYKGPFAQGAGSLSGQALDGASEIYYETGKMPPNLGRGMQGAANMDSIITRATQLHPDDPAADWPTRWQQFGAQGSGARVLANRAAGLDLAENEARTLIPRVREISSQVSRTQYPSINSLILAARQGTGDPNVIRLGVAVESLIPVYARALKPQGQISVSDMERAHHILDKAWSQGQIDAALDQMNIELNSAQQALTKTQREYGTKGGQEQHQALPAAPAPQASQAPQAPHNAGGATKPGRYRYDPSTGKLVPM